MRYKKTGPDPRDWLIINLFYRLGIFDIIGSLAGDAVKQGVFFEQKGAAAAIHVLFFDLHKLLFSLEDLKQMHASLTLPSAEERAAQIKKTGNAMGREESEFFLKTVELMDAAFPYPDKASLQKHFDLHETVRQTIEALCRGKDLPARENVVLRHEDFLNKAFDFRWRVRHMVDTSYALHKILGDRLEKFFLNLHFLGVNIFDLKFSEADLVKDTLGSSRHQEAREYCENILAALSLISAFLYEDFDFGCA